MNFIKKIALFLLLTTAIGTSHTYAQVGLRLGVKGGFNISSLTKNSDGTFDPKTSWAGGAFLGLSLCKAFVIQPEFIVRQGGATQNKSQNYTNVTLNYFQIPVLFKLRLPLGSVVYPNIFAGPTFDFVTSSSYSRTSSQNGTDTNILTTPIRKNGTGGLVGAGIDLELGLLYLSLDGRYGIGFRDIATQKLAVRGTYYTFMVGVGLKFGN